MLILRHWPTTNAWSDTTLDTRGQLRGLSSCDDAHTPEK